MKKIPIEGRIGTGEESTSDVNSRVREILLADTKFFRGTTDQGRQHSAGVLSEFLPASADSSFGILPSVSLGDDLDLSSINFVLHNTGSSHIRITKNNLLRDKLDLVETAEAGKSPSQLATLLVRTSSEIASKTDTINRCWNGVANALDAISTRKTWGVSAFKSSSDYLDSDSRFGRLKESNSSFLPIDSMKPGDIFALPWTSYGESLHGGRRDGHVAVFLGKGALIDRRGNPWTERSADKPRFVSEKEFDQFPSLKNFVAKDVESSDHLAYMGAKPGYYDYVHARIWRAKQG